MASRRGAMKVNPVTGKMEKMDEKEAGLQRDGCLVLPEKYMNAAKDLGLGGAGGMYTHIKSLAKVGGTDIPVGPSIESEADSKARAAALSKPKATLDATNTEAVKEAIRTTVTSTSGGGRIAGFGPTSTSAGSGYGASSFQHRKGVVNTLGGAKDISRDSSMKGVAEPAKLAPRPADGSMPGAKIMTVSHMDAHAMEGKAKREAAASKMAASAAASKGGLGGGGGGGGAAITGFTKTGAIGTVKKAHGTAMGGGGGGGVSVSAPAPHHSSSSSSSAANVRVPITGSGHVLGGSSSSSTSGGGGGAGMDAKSIAEKRAEFFKQKAAEQAAKMNQAVGFLKGEVASVAAMED